MNTQKGFAFLEGLVITIVLVLIGFGGYTVWHGHNLKTNSEDRVIAKSQSPDTSSTDDVVLVVQSDRTIQKMKISTLTDKSLAGALTAVSRYCGGSGRFNAAIAALVLSGDSELYKHDESHVSLSTGCQNPNNPNDERNTGFAIEASKRGNSWSIDASGQQAPPCSKVDNKGYTAAITMCQDVDSGTERAPQI